MQYLQKLQHTAKKCLLGEMKNLQRVTSPAPTLELVPLLTLPLSLYIEILDVILFLAITCRQHNVECKLIENAHQFLSKQGSRVKPQIK